MMDPISDNIVNAAIDYMNKYNTDYYRVLNCDELVFTMQDLNLTRGADGKVVRNGNTPILMSWMINHQVLKTDVGDRAFRDPFVYADDAAVAETAEVSNIEQVKQSTNEKVKQVTATVEPKYEQPRQPSDEIATEESKKTATIELPQQDKALTYDETIAAGLTPKQGYTYVRKADGKYVILPNNSRVLQKMLGNKGVFSTVRGEGTLDIAAAKKWLHDTLGIDPDDVMVTNAAMRAINTPSAYGLLQSVFDRIHDEFVARIVLSTKGGAGVEYHEAWHYVSLLLLTPAQRDQIYSDYVKRNPEYSNSTKQEIEEQLAEEFKAYMLKEVNPTWTYRIKKFFKAIWDLVMAFAGKELSLQNQVFNQIRKGNFKNAQLDQDTLDEFNKKYDVGIGYYAPGISNKEQENMPHVANANTLYNIVETLSNTALSILNIRSMDDIQNLKLDDVFDNIQYLYDAGEYDYNESKKQMVHDVLSNKGLFAKQIRAYLQELGIRAIEREEAEIAEKEAKDSGDTYDNVWDRASYEISKKANVAFNAKLFFYSIPQSKFVTDEMVIKQQIL